MNENKNSDELYWLKLLKYWVLEKDRTGLTLPYIIGAKQYSRNNEKAEMPTIVSFLKMISESEIDEFVIIRWCTNLQEYVIGLDIGNISDNIIGPKNLKLAMDSNVLGKSLESICNSLESRYSGFVREKKFSKHFGGWGPFSEDDFHDIEEAFNR